MRPWLRRSHRRRELVALRAELAQQAVALQAIESVLYPAWLRQAMAHARGAGWSIAPVAERLRFSAPDGEAFTLSRSALLDGLRAPDARRELSLRLGIGLASSAPGADRELTLAARAR